jgi:hypothetical protein
MANLTRDGFEMEQKFRKEKRRRLKNKVGLNTGAKEIGRSVGRGISALTPGALGRTIGKAILPPSREIRDPVQPRRPRDKKPTMLTGGQAELDKNKNNKIDAQDFKILRAEKAKGRGMGLQDEKMKPGKVKKAVVGMLAVGMGAKKNMMKRKTPMALGAAGAATAKLSLMKKILGLDKGGMGEAKNYKKYLKGLKDVKNKTDLQKSKFIQRRITLGGREALKAAKATKIGKIAAGVAGAALLAKAGLEKMYEKRTGKKPFTKRPDKKMGGGMMMKKPMMANIGVMAGKEGYKKLMEQRAKDRITDRDVKESNKKVQVQKGRDKAKKVLKKMRNFKNQATGFVKEIGGFKKGKMMMGGGLTEATQKLKAQGKMGGGMMQRPMMAMGGGMMPGYKKGKSVMAKGCKLGRKKPTKMYT